MGTLYCLKCAQTVKAKTLAEADVLIDHAATSKKCSGNTDYMRWDGEKLDFVAPVKKTETKRK
jgi:hypothetical protein